MSDLYRRDMSATIDVVTYDIKGGIIEYDGADELLADIEEAGVFVKVEPCKHGNYAPHPKTTFQYEMVDGVEWFALTFCNGTPNEVNYLTGAVLRSAELAAEDDDPELHHHEPTDSIRWCFAHDEELGTNLSVCDSEWRRNERRVRMGEEVQQNCDIGDARLVRVKETI